MRKKNMDIGSTRLAKSILKSRNAIVGTAEKKGMKNIRSVPLPRKFGKQRTMPLPKGMRTRSLPLMKGPKKFRSVI